MDHTLVNLIQLKTFELESNFAEYIKCICFVLFSLLCHFPVFLSAVYMLYFLYPTVLVAFGSSRR